MSIELPDSPKGKEFEEYISSFFQCAGYYVEKNVTEDSILELDIIVTDYNGLIPRQCLVEVKSGKWGFHDVFKVKGWMVYLNIDIGYFIVQGGINAKHQEKAAELNITLLSDNDVSALEGKLCEKMSCKNFDIIELESWRFSYWVERILIDSLLKKKKTASGVKRYFAMADYYNTVNHDIFFTQCIVDKIDALYSTYQNYPNLSAKVANEIIGNDFEEEYSDIPQSVYKKAYYTCEETDLNLSTFIEHRSRLAIMKAGIDYIMFKKEGVIEKVDKSITFTFNDKPHKIDMFNHLPETFRSGLTKLEKHKYCKNYPIFWQYFMWIMGGFILNDYYDEEIKFLSIKSGIPIDEIGNALSSYDILFPTSNGWFKDLSPLSNIIILKNFPVPFHGIGVNWKVHLYTSTHSLTDLKLSGSYTKNDLTRWINATTIILDKHNNT